MRDGQHGGASACGDGGAGCVHVEACVVVVVGLLLLLVLGADSCLGACRRCSGGVVVVGAGGRGRGRGRGGGGGPVGGGRRGMCHVPAVGSVCVKGQDERGEVMKIMRRSEKG